MPLNLGNDGGSSKKFIRYMASTGSWSKSEKNENGDYQDVTFDFGQAVFDFSNIKTGWVEWSSNSTGASMGIADLYSEYEKQAEDGKLPVVKFAGVKPVKVGMGSTNVPLFEITKMAKTPEELQSGLDSPAVTVANDEDEFPE